MSSRTPGLVGRCAKERSPELWEEFVRIYGRRLAAGMHRALRRSGARWSAQDKEDVVQEIYCRLLEARGSRLARCGSLDESIAAAYLGRVAERVTIDHLRAAAASKRGSDCLVDSVGSRTGMDRVSGARSTTSSPEEDLLAREMQLDFLARCGRAVAPRSRKRNLKILYLAFFEGWSSREIAERLGGGLTASSIDSLMHRLKRRLAKAGIRLPRR